MSEQTRVGNDDLLHSYSENLLGVYGMPQTVLVRGEGCRVWDADGREYLDLLAGIAVNALGHAHPELVSALTQQAATLGHVSNFFASPAQISAAETLNQILPVHGKVLFVNSGTEANEAALKVARAHRSGGRIVALRNAFHGRTLGSLSVTWKPAYREPFEPLIPGVDFIEATTAALTQAMSEDVAAVIVEPIQGEAGVIDLPTDFLKRARQLADHYGALLILDEVQTGIGRTGDWFGFSASGIIPDVVTMAKGLGGGFPVGAMALLTPAAQQALDTGMHGTTFGGNPLAGAMVQATLKTILKEGLLDHARLLGAAWSDELIQLPQVSSVSGRGLLLGVHLAPGISAKAVSKAMFEHGIIVNAPTEQVLRLAPPLIINKTECDQFTRALSVWEVN